MEERTQTEFEAWIKAIPHGDYEQIRAQVITECGVSRATFASWLRGDTSPDSDNRITITVIAYRYDNERLPFSNMTAELDEEGEIRVIIRQPKKME